MKVIFYQKRTKPCHPPVFLNKFNYEQKQLGMILISCLNFNSHMHQREDTQCKEGRRYYSRTIYCTAQDSCAG